MLAIQAGPIRTRFVRAATYRNFVNDQRGGLHNLLVLLYRIR
jgi:hypothetical protein